MENNTIDYMSYQTLSKILSESKLVPMKGIDNEERDFIYRRRVKLSMLH